MILMVLRPAGRYLLGLSVLGLLIVLGIAYFLLAHKPEDPTPAANQRENGPQPATPVRANQWALLVGVTRYDHLDPIFHLRGPGNDVRLMQHLLRERYGFPNEQMATLTEDEGLAERRPTRANIEREFRRLSERVREGDQVVVLMAGHGERQPEADPPNPKYPEPDGIDEVFLPADVKKWRGFPDRVPQAIVDDELGEWLEAITRKRAHVWAIFDCCHSGDIRRGTEILRELPPGQLVPAEEYPRARARAKERAGKDREAPSKSPAFVSPAPSDYLVALYACRAHETTPECRFPAGQAGARYHGLLTYTLAEVLSRSADAGLSLTYQELVQRIQLQYAGRLSGAPTPTVVGKGQSRTVLGIDRPRRPPLTLTKGTEGYQVDAGDLFGLTPASVLAVQTPASSRTKPKLLGHVRVVSTRAFDAVVEPIAYDEKPKPESLPELAACQVVYSHLELPRFKVAVEAPRGQEMAKQFVETAIRSLWDPRNRLVDLVAGGEQADWLIQLDGPVPLLVEGSGNRPPLPLLPVDADAFSGALKDSLETIHRARNLIALSTRLEQTRAENPEVVIEVEMLRRQNGKDSEKVTPEPDGEVVLRPGDTVSFRIRNTSPFHHVDVCLLLVGLDLKIGAFYPEVGEMGKVLAPGQSLTTPEAEINPRPPFGKETMVVLAAPARNPPVNFALLAQPGLKERGYQDISPLAQLLERAMERNGTRAGLKRIEVQQHAIRVLTWRTEAAGGK